MGKNRQSEENLDNVVEAILEVMGSMLDVPAERLTWSIANAFRTLARDFATGPTTLINKMLKVAQSTIRRQEGVPTTIVDVVNWRLFGARGHEVIASVEVTVDDGSRAFTVWVVANLDTEEVYCL